jgi:hypothetical protein
LSWAASLLARTLHHAEDDTTYGVRLSDRGLVSRKSGEVTVQALEIVLLIGAAEYPLTRIQAERLEKSIRECCLDERGLPLDDEARACLQLADVLAEDLAAGSSPEPIDLRMSHLDGLRTHVADDRAALLPDLLDVVRRYCGG